LTITHREAPEDIDPTVQEMHHARRAPIGGDAIGMTWADDRPQKRDRELAVLIHNVGPDD
jgi:hypothetical protein